MTAVGSADLVGATSVRRAVKVLCGLKWSLLRGGFRGSMQQRIQTAMSVVFALVFGLVALGVLSAVGHGIGPSDDILVVLLPVLVVGVGLLSAATGVESTIDARHLASEPLTRWGLGLGLLAAASVGPPALLAVLAGLGIIWGWLDGGALGAVLVVASVVAWWFTLLLVSRTLANLLGAVATGRFRQIAQAGATLSALLVWLIAQVAARDPDGWNVGRWATLADIAEWTPPGQLALAITTADAPGTALLHLVAGIVWLPLLAWASVASTERLALSSPRPGSGPTRRASRAGSVLRSGFTRFLPPSPAGAIAARTVRTKFRTPRQAVNTITALAVGAGVFFIGPVLDGGSPDPRVVLVGGLLHFAVLFDGNNCFGMDGPAIWMEIGAGADARVLVRGKTMSSLTVMAIPALVLPVSLAVISGGWIWLPAAWLIAAGSLLAAAGVSVASASLAPVAMPESPNPLAAGDTGQGCVAGLMLVICMTVLGVVSAPVALAVLLASSRSVPLATAAALLAPVVGVLVLWGGSAVATGRLRGHEAELVQHVTPAR